MIRRAFRRIATLDVAIFAVAVAILTGFELSHQQAPAPGPPVDSYSSYDAASGGYRAFYELLGREGVRTERFEQQPAFLDPGMTALVYSEPQVDPSTQNDARDLEAWVRGGGTLIYFGHDDHAAKAKILAQPYSRRQSEKSHALALSGTLQDAGVVSLGHVAGELRWKQPAKRVRVLFDDGRGPVAITYPFGKGTVVETIDETFLDNANLGKGDRARFAMALVTLVHPTNAVWFDEAIHDHLAPLNWYSIVPRAFIYALIGATIVMLVAIAGAALRLGPPILPPVADDRTSADFIDALSTLFERGKASRKALDDAVRSTTRAVSRSVGLTGDPTAAEIAARIQDEERRDAFETMLAGAAETAPDPHRFVRTIALAQRLRKDSVSHGR